MSKTNQASLEPTKKENLGDIDGIITKLIEEKKADEKNAYHLDSPGVQILLDALLEQNLIPAEQEGVNRKLFDTDETFAAATRMSQAMAAVAWAEKRHEEVLSKKNA